ncbi:MAG: hypothetical protein E7436_08785 [Ruminococcaceae bacterium]|nr:hypothetical protein [Oscillospiraceae bacterium]
MSSILDRIHISEPELYKTDAELGDFTLDAQFVPLRNPDGTFTFLITGYSEKPYFRRFIGTPEDILLKPEEYEMDYNGYCDREPSGIWIMSAYKYDDGMLVGFCHRELIHHTDPAFGNSFLIGLAVSHNGGKRWRYIGDIVSNVLNGGSIKANMGGVPLLVRDGYFYIYFNDADHDHVRRISAARMRIDETRECLLQEKLPTVRKYTGNGMWRTDPMKCAGANIIPDVGYEPDAHAKGVYCKALDRYLLTAQTGTSARLLMFISKDCEHFDEHLVVDVGMEGVQMQPYSFFVATDGDCSDDMNTIGREFYIYYPRKGTRIRNPKEFGDYGYDDLYRVKVTID